MNAVMICYHAQSVLGSTYEVRQIDPVAERQEISRFNVYKNTTSGQLEKLYATVFVRKPSGLHVWQCSCPGWTNYQTEDCKHIRACKAEVNAAARDGGNQLDPTGPEETTLPIAEDLLRNADTYQSDPTHPQAVEIVRVKMTVEGLALRTDCLGWWSPTAKECTLCKAVRQCKAVQRDMTVPMVGDGLDYAAALQLEEKIAAIRDIPDCR